MDRVKNVPGAWADDDDDVIMGSWPRNSKGLHHVRYG